MAINDNRGRQIPFFVEHFTYEDIQTANFDPITSLHNATHVHPTELNASEVGEYSQKGFLIRPDTDGLIYGITWRDYIDNKKSLTGLSPQAYLASANTWIECAYVKIYAHNDATYPSGSHYINVAPIV
jgi:hypothetical protein